MQFLKPVALVQDALTGRFLLKSFKNTLISSPCFFTPTLFQIGAKAGNVKECFTLFHGSVAIVQWFA